MPPFPFRHVAPCSSFWLDLIVAQLPPDTHLEKKPKMIWYLLLPLFLGIPFRFAGPAHTSCVLPPCRQTFVLYP